MKTTAFAREGKDARRDPMSLLILGKALIDLSGLRTLRVRSDFKFAAGMMGNSSMKPMHTTRKSSQFQ